MSNEFRKIKIAVGTPAKSRAIQEFLFTQGCRWNFDGPKVKLTEAKYLFIEDSGSIGWDSSDSFFERSTQYKEVSFLTELKTVVTGHILKERPKTVLFGKTYYTDDLNARLADLAVAE
jgi:hypothetical protein